MPLTCSHCGAQNPDGMQFCQSCGSPLMPTPQGTAPAPGAPEPATPPAGPPPSAPEPPAPQPAPARGPVPQPAPAHRLPLGSLIGIVIGVLGILAAIGILTSHRGSSAPTIPFPTAYPTSPPAQPTFAPQPTAPSGQPTAPAAQPTAPAEQPTLGPQPTVDQGQPTAPAEQPTVVSQPTEAVSQPTSPVAQPTAVVTQPSVPGQTFSTTTFSVLVPSGWQVANQTTTPTENEVVLQDPSTAPNGVDIFAGQNTAQTDAGTVLQSVITNLQQKFPDAKQCGSTVPITFGGVAGTLMPICYTITPQGGAAVSVAELAWAATDATGSNVYFVGQTAAANNQPFFTHAGDVTKTIVWGGGQ